MSGGPSSHRRVLVTGATGQLGRAVVDAARGRGSAVIALSHRDLAVEDAGAVASSIGGARADLVVHCAAWTDVDGCERDENRAFAVNAAGARNVADACRSTGARLVHVSTDYVFGDEPWAGAERRPLREDDPVGPRSTYGKSKLAGEQAVLAAPLPDGWYVVRTAWVFGPGGRNFPAAILDSARRGKPLRVVDDQVGCPTLTIDLAAAILDLAASTAPAGIYHATNSGRCSWHQFAVAVLGAAGMELPVARMTSAELARPAPRPAWSVLDGSKLEAVLGRTQPPWRDALRRYLAAERQETTS